MYAKYAAHTNLLVYSLRRSARLQIAMNDERGNSLSKSCEDSKRMPVVKAAWVEMDFIAVHLHLGPAFHASWQELNYNRNEFTD